MAVATVVVSAVNVCTLFVCVYVCVSVCNVLSNSASSSLAAYMCIRSSYISPSFSILPSPPPPPPPPPPRLMDTRKPKDRQPGRSTDQQRLQRRLSTSL